MQSERAWHICLQMLNLRRENYDGVLTTLNNQTCLTFHVNDVALRPKVKRRPGSGVEDHSFPSHPYNPTPCKCQSQCQSKTPSHSSKSSSIESHKTEELISSLFSLFYAAQYTTRNCSSARLLYSPHHHA